jgi:hypothetical protein
MEAFTSVTIAAKSVGVEAAIGKLVARNSVTAASYTTAKPDNLARGMAAMAAMRTVEGHSGNSTTDSGNSTTDFGEELYSSSSSSSICC